MNYLCVRNWARFQHYKGQDSPPWIKLYRDLLNDYEFNQLSELERGRLMRIWLLAASDGGRIPNDSKWVAQKIGAKSLDLDSFIVAGFLEKVYSESRDPLVPAEQRRSTEKRADKNPRDGGVEGAYVYPEFAAAKLLKVLTNKDPDTERTIERIAHRYRLVEADFGCALDAASGPGVASPAAVAVAELMKRGKARQEAA